jgi:hypothetical protein
VTKIHPIRATQIVTAFFIDFNREVFTKMSREGSRKETFNKFGLKQEKTVVDMGDIFFFL